MSLIDRILSVVAEDKPQDDDIAQNKDAELYSPDFLALCKNDEVDNAPTED
jgi:hypothetical protein